METIFWVWLAIIVVALLVEIVTLDLVSIWFSIGAIIPLILSAIGGIPIELQISVFVVITALLIICLRKYAQKLLFKNMDTRTNIDSQIGKIYPLVEGISPEQSGAVKINGVVWTAISCNDETIEKGQKVEIIKIDGNKLIVKKINDAKQNTYVENKIDCEVIENEENIDKSEIDNKEEK